MVVLTGPKAGSMHERIKEHDRDIRLARTQTSAVSEHASNRFGHNPFWDEVKFINRDPHWYTRRVKEAIHIRLYPNNIITCDVTETHSTKSTGQPMLTCTDAPTKDSSLA